MKKIQIFSLLFVALFFLILFTLSVNAYHYYGYSYTTRDTTAYYRPYDTYSPTTIRTVYYDNYGYPYQYSYRKLPPYYVYPSTYYCYNCRNYYSKPRITTVTYQPYSDYPQYSHRYYDSYSYNRYSY